MIFLIKALISKFDLLKKESSNENDASNEQILFQILFIYSNYLQLYSTALCYINYSVKLSTRIYRAISTVSTGPFKVHIL